MGGRRRPPGVASDLQKRTSAAINPTVHGSRSSNQYHTYIYLTRRVSSTEFIIYASRSEWKGVRYIETPSSLDNPRPFGSIPSLFVGVWSKIWDAAEGPGRIRRSRDPAKPAASEYCISRHISFLRLSPLACDFQSARSPKLAAQYTSPTCLQS